MEKRGQISAFIIIGIVILAVFGLVFYYRDLFVEKVLGPEGTRRMLSNQLEFVKIYVEGCINKNSLDVLNALGKHGSLNLNNYVNYYGREIESLCTKQTTGCLNRMFLFSSVQDDLESELYPIKMCIDGKLQNSNRYDITKGDFSVNVKIEQEFVMVNVIYPITLTRKEISVEIKDFYKKINIPLGRIGYAINDILNKEAVGENFDVTLYMMSNLNRYDITKDIMSGYKVYNVSTPFGKYNYLFAVQT